MFGSKVYFGIAVAVILSLALTSSAQKFDAPCCQESWNVVMKPLVDAFKTNAKNFDKEDFKKVFQPWRDLFHDHNNNISKDVTDGFGICGAIPTYKCEGGRCKCNEGAKVENNHCVQSSKDDYCNEERLVKCKGSSTCMADGPATESIGHCVEGGGNEGLSVNATSSAIKTPRPILFNQIGSSTLVLILTIILSTTGFFTL